MNCLMQSWKIRLSSVGKQLIDSCHESLTQKFLIQTRQLLGKQIIYRNLLIFTCNVTEPPCLEKHADDGHHSQASIRQLGIQSPGLGPRVISGEDRWVPSHVARSALVYICIISCWNLTVSAVAKDLNPARQWNLVKGTANVTPERFPRIFATMFWFQKFDHLLSLVRIRNAAKRALEMAARPFGMSEKSNLLEGDK